MDGYKNFGFKKHECDFVVKQGRTMREAIQVCHELNEDNQAREIDGLREAMQACRLFEGIVLTYDQDDETTIKGKKIRILPVWKWLLEK